MDGRIMAHGDRAMDKETDLLMATDLRDREARSVAEKE
jgi:hypothetical protein